MKLKCPKCGCDEDLMGDGDTIECPDCGYNSREENFIVDTKKPSAILVATKGRYEL